MRFRSSSSDRHVLAIVLHHERGLGCVLEGLIRRQHHRGGAAPLVRSVETGRRDALPDHRLDRPQQAMARIGGEHWRAWRGSMRRSVIFSQRLEGHRRGSWDPVGPWGFAGGRVYATALMLLSLQAQST